MIIAHDYEIPDYSSSLCSQCCLLDNLFELCSKLNSIYICVICYRWAHTSVSNLANLKVLDGEMNYKCVSNEISVSNFEKILPE